MAVYTGKINLINMSDITATVGNGIQSTLVLYAISDSGVEPPDLVNIPLETIEGGLLAFWEIGATFHLVKDELWARKDGKNVQLSISDDLITGIVGKADWDESIPEVPNGWYLWSKTIFYYTNGEQTIVYGVTKYGENGKDGIDGKDGKDGKDGEVGPQGPPGENTSAYKLEFNQTEILKFVSKEQAITISPENLTVKLLKQNPLSSSGYDQIEEMNAKKLSAQIYNLNTGNTTDIPVEFIKNDELIKNIVTIDLGQLIRIAPSDEELYQITKELQLGEGVLKITYNHTEEKKNYFLVDFLDIRFAMGKDIASLDIYANGIFSSMQDSKLSFTAEGLTIKNGAFKIVKELDDGTTDKLLYSDNDGNLAIKGNIYADQGYFKGDISGASGTFSGDISAATGTFHGRLEAEDGFFNGNISGAKGTIGGFEIGTTQLISTKTNENGVANIILDGTNGKITAENIELGAGATIRESIKLGDAVTLKNPTSKDISFIKVKDGENNLLTLSADGTFSVGYGDNLIILSGADGSITSNNYKDGMGWKISNTESIFNDVTVRGSIRASVLEYGETQAIGGALLVRPSSRILSAVLSEDKKSTILTLEEIDGFNKGDICRLDVQTKDGIGRNYYKIESIDIDSKKITISGNAHGSEGKPIVSFGQGNDNIGISINGSTDQSFSTPQAISVFESIFTEEDSTIKTKLAPRIVLGKLPNEPNYGYAAGTYGLYAENVLLKGALVTQTKDEGETYYSGINTIYSDDASNQPTSDKYKENFQTKKGAPILLWAGARRDDKEGIEDSNFFVDRNGNMYANSGYFKGTIITDASISASEISTAILKGTGTTPALTIENAATGIVFNSIDSSGASKTVFKVAESTIEANVPNFKFNSNFTIGENGSLVVPKLYTIGENKNKKALVFDESKISYTGSFDENDLGGITAIAYVDFSNGISFSSSGVGADFNLSTTEARFKKNLYLEGSIQYNEFMEYRPVYSGNTLIGYDLYVD